MVSSEEAEAMLPSFKSTTLSPASGPSPPSSRIRNSNILRRTLLGVLSCALLYCLYTMLVDGAAVLALASTPQVVIGATKDSSSSGHAPKVPDYFQTSPELWPGPTATGRAPFLAQTNPVSFAPSATFIPNAPLETAEPIVGNTHNHSIFQLMGFLSPYFPNPVGFGVAEYPLPAGAKIVQVQMLSRHGSRYPTLGSQPEGFGQRIAEAAGKLKATGILSFLNDWKYELGAEILVPRGRQELFESGVLHYYQYGRLYNPYSKIIARTTTQDRMLKSAENFMAGFFGLEWPYNATLELIIESNGFNNSLAGYDNCPNSNKAVNGGGNEVTNEWINIYLQNATQRLQGMIKGYEWTVADTYAAQMLCPYETVAYGYSAFCSLFTYEEYKAFSHANSLSFSGTAGFQSPTGRAMGLGYVQEVVARLENHTLGYSGSQINVTLDNNTDTFPLNQSLYFDFSHDTNIMAILTAFGFRQFAAPLDPTKMPIDSEKTNLTVSHVTPFAARLDIEIIKTPSPLGADRKYVEGKETTYVHFLLNQRTLPLGFSLPACDVERLDGWCEFETFLKVQKEEMAKADFDFACFGEYEAVPYGKITDGRPLGRP